MRSIRQFDDPAVRPQPSLFQRGALRQPHHVPGAALQSCDDPRALGGGLVEWGGGDAALQSFRRFGEVNCAPVRVSSSGRRIRLLVETAIRCAERLAARLSRSTVVRARAVLELAVSG